MSKYTKHPPKSGKEAEEEISLALAGSDDLGSGFQIIRWGPIGSKAAFTFPNSKKHFLLHHFDPDELEDICDSLMGICRAMKVMETGDEHEIARYFWEELGPDEIPEGTMH